MERILQLYLGVILDLEIQVFKEDKVLTDIRSALYKKICNGSAGSLKEWKYIIGVESAKNVQLKKETVEYLRSVVEYLNSDEGKQDIKDVGISLDHYDDLIELVRSSKNKRQLKNGEFLIMMKNRRKIIDYLTRSY